MSERIEIRIDTTVQAPMNMVWDRWTDPWHILHWNQASENWHTPTAVNDLRAGGNFLYRM